MRHISDHPRPEPSPMIRRFGRLSAKERKLPDGPVKLLYRVPKPVPEHSRLRRYLQMERFG